MDNSIYNKIKNQELEYLMIKDTNVRYDELEDNEKKVNSLSNKKMIDSIERCFLYLKENDPIDVKAFIKFITDINHRVFFYPINGDRDWVFYERVHWKLKYEGDFSLFLRSINLLYKLINNSTDMVLIDDFLDEIVSLKNRCNEKNMNYLIWNYRIKELIMCLVSSLHDYLEKCYPEYLIYFEEIMLDNVIDDVILEESAYLWNADERELIYRIYDVWYDKVAKLVYDYTKNYIVRDSGNYTRAISLLFKFGRDDLANYLITGEEKIQDEKRRSIFDRFKIKRKKKSFL